jgi:hypothetical protein
MEWSSRQFKVSPGSNRLATRPTLMHCLNDAISFHALTRAMHTPIIFFKKIIFIYIQLLKHPLINLFIKKKHDEKTQKLLDTSLNVFTFKNK